MRIHLAVTIDTECDKGAKWRVRQPLRFRNILEGVPERLQPLFEAAGVKPTYLLSPEVLADDDCVGLFKSLGDSVELGSHLHAEFIEPGARWDTDNTDTFQCELAPEIEHAKLANLTRLFEKRIGYRPTSFRAGRYAIGPDSLRFLEDLGYRVDSSVTPFKWWWRRRGYGVNFLGAPYQPYHPDARDFRRPGRMKLLEVPVTLVNPFWDRFPQALLRRLNPLNRYQTIALNLLFRSRLEPAWLRPTFATAREMISLTDHVVENHTDEAKAPVLCLMFHSNEATLATSPYIQEQEALAEFLKRMRDYFAYLSDHFDVSAVGLSDLANKEIYKYDR